MTTAHAICARVRILYQDGSLKSPSWTSEQIDEILQQSPVFERQILRLLHNSQYVWNIKPANTDGFDDIAVNDFMGDLGRPPESDVENRVKLEGLSSRCCAIWHFEVIPSKFHIASHATDNDGKVLAHKDAATPKTLSVSTLASGGSGGSGSSVPTSPGNSSTELELWCWNCESDHSSQEIALKLANIALILDWKEAFRREIKTVIWNWQGVSFKDTGTPVERLQNDGPEGLQGEFSQKLNGSGGITLTSTRKKETGNEDNNYRVV